MAAISTAQTFSLITRKTLIKGKPTEMECVEIGGQTYAVSKGAVTLLSLEDEWYDDVRDPEATEATSAPRRRIRSTLGRWRSMSTSPM